MKKQGGMTLIGWVTVLAIVAFFATVFMRLLPMYQEYYAVLSVMKGMKSELKDNKLTRQQVWNLLEKRFDTGYIFSVKKENVEMDRGKNTTHVTKIVIDYEVRKPFMAHIDLVGHFHTEVDVAPKRKR